MAYARTQKGAKERVKMKRALRRDGQTVNSDITTTRLRERYRKLKR